MEVTDNQIIKNFAQQCMRCFRFTILPYEYEWTCFSYGYNGMK